MKLECQLDLAKDFFWWGGEGGKESLNNVDFFKKCLFFQISMFYQI